MMGHSIGRIVVSSALAVAFSLPASAAASTWKIDPAHSSAQFSVRHLAISTVRGAFSSVNGSINFGGKDVTKSTVHVTIDGYNGGTRQPAHAKDSMSEGVYLYCDPH